jgi:4-hydroxybenzoyl-CoA reductase subunit beta
MLRLPEFDFQSPATIEEACKILADQGAGAMLVAGGTDIYPKMKRRQFLPKTLIGLSQFTELKGIQGDASTGVVLGAGVSLSEVSSNSIMTESYPGLAKAAGVVSTPILRNMGTIGGNICLDTRCNYYDQTQPWRESIGWCMKAPNEAGWPVINDEKSENSGIPCRVAPGSPRCWAVSSTDCAPMLIALGAKLKLVGSSGERVIPIGEFYNDDGMFYLNKGHDELLTEVILPQADGIKSTYWKLRRRESFDFPVLGVAVAVKQAADDTIEDAKIVIGGIGSKPFEMAEAQQLLIGNKPTPELIESSAEAVFNPARPLDNTDFHLFHRKRMAPIYVKRALNEILL